MNAINNFMQKRRFMKHTKEMHYAYKQEILWSADHSIFLDASTRIEHLEPRFAHTEVNIRRGTVDDVLDNNIMMRTSNTCYITFTSDKLYQDYFYNNSNLYNIYKELGIHKCFPVEGVYTPRVQLTKDEINVLSIPLDTFKSYELFKMYRILRFCHRNKQKNLILDVSNIGDDMIEKIGDDLEFLFTSKFKNVFARVEILVSKDKYEYISDIFRKEDEEGFAGNPDRCISLIG